MSSDYQFEEPIVQRKHWKLQLQLNVDRLRRQVFCLVLSFGN